MTDEEKYRAAARKYFHEEGDLEFDDTAVVSESTTGAYVQCWKWVDASDAGIPCCNYCGKTFGPDDNMYRIGRTDQYECRACKEGGEN